ncbi:MAG: tetratricopeptide repeat protein, partial [Cyclobacteriaceae bacterium]|nr:tetratricopeptide repeat protein [Cyclobacteriaceae bacterium]
MPNKLSRFWQELKRRNVVRVITVYAGAAFVILELTDIITEPLKLPSWLLPVVIVLLSIGFIIAIILSWIYDIIPEGGLEKTEPAHKVKEEDIPKSSNTWKIASYISFVVIVGLILLNIIPRVKETKERTLPDKSIAVRPFWNESTDQKNESFVIGMTEDIRNNLAKIADLRVQSRGSVEKYRDTDYTTLDIARDLNVSYILEGTAQRIEDQVKINVQLILAETDDHVWEASYREEIADVKQVFDIQNQIAQAVATEIKAIIAPEEKELMEKNMTFSLRAYDFYQKGREELWKISFDNDLDANYKAEGYFHDALRYDPAYALAYSGLAWTFFYEHVGENVLSESYLDSTLILANIALEHDNQLSDAHLVKGQYYFTMGRPEQAIENLDLALKYNPNSWMAYRIKGSSHLQNNFVESIESSHNAALHHRGSQISDILRTIGYAYVNAGFSEMGKFYQREAFKLDKDTLRDLLTSARFEGNMGNYLKFVELYEQGKLDTTNENILWRAGYNYLFLGKYEKALKLFETRLNIAKSVDLEAANGSHRIAYTHFKLGNQEKAEFYFNKQLEFGFTEIKLDRWEARQRFAHYDIAAV